MALRLSEAGLNLVLVARRRQRLEEIAAIIALQQGVQTRILAADLGKQAGIAAVQEYSEDLDVGLLVAAAGFGTAGQFLKADLAQEYDMLDVNCRAVLALCYYFSKRLARRGRGGMVLMASLLGFQGVPNAAHYAATKAYVQSLAEALHVELAPRGIDVLASAPGPVNSGFAARAKMRMGLALQPAEVAQATLDALGRKTTAVPGLLSKVLSWSLLPLPRSARVGIMGAVMGGMTKHLEQKPKKVA
jgi:short-subunit dehydrogenase